MLKGPSLSLTKQMPPGGYVPALGTWQVAQSTERGSAEVALCRRCPCAPWGPRATEGTKPVVTGEEANGTLQSGQGPKVGQGHPRLRGA